MTPTYVKNCTILGLTTIIKSGEAMPNPIRNDMLTMNKRDLENHKEKGRL